jgi:4-amino-4-deoxy-L-arabinose transferase-like glycosyltransferase
MIKKTIESIRKDKVFLLVFLIFLVGAFLRFYRLEEFATFLADQGRDAIIVKRIVTLEHLPAIGPSTSIGQVFLGPFYYYFIAPWLLIFHFNPVGLAVGVGFFSSLFILVNYFMVKELFNKKIALISSFLIVFSSTQIEFSRFSWNPNLLPLFTLLTLYFLIKALKTNRTSFYFLTGAFLSFCFQLHYLALFLIPPVLISLMVQIIELKGKRERIVFNSFMILFSFLFFSLPLLIFDLRHEFINAKNFLNLFKSSAEIVGNRLENLISTFSYLNQYVFYTSFNNLFTLVLLMVLFVSFLFLIKKKQNIRTVWLFLILMLGGISLYSGPKHPHYLGILYPAYFIILAYLLFPLCSNLLGKILLGVFFLGFIILNSNGYYFFFKKGQNQMFHAQKVATLLDKIITVEKFNFAVQPDGWQEDAYLYFLELEGKRPLDRKKVEIGDEMFVVCGNPCDLYKTRSWNINMFGKFKILNQWSVDDVKIYRLIHKL